MPRPFSPPHTLPMCFLLSSRNGAVTLVFVTSGTGQRIGAEIIRDRAFGRIADVICKCKPAAARSPWEKTHAVRTVLYFTYMMYVVTACLNVHESTNISDIHHLASTSSISRPLASARRVLSIYLLHPLTRAKRNCTIQSVAAPPFLFFFVFEFGNLFWGFCLFLAF